MDSSVSQLTPIQRPRSARAADLMLARILTQLIHRRCCCYADVREHLPLGVTYAKCIDSLEAAGLVKQCPYYNKKRPFDYNALVDRAELARHLRRVVARIDRAESGGDK